MTLPGGIGVRVAAAVFLADQASKLVVVHLLGLKMRGLIEVLPGILRFQMAWNDGVNFGLFGGGPEIVRWGFVALALGISAWVILWMRRDAAGPAARAAAGLLVGGALGNTVDRVIYGAVADFLNVSCCGIENPYAFNLADVAIFVGAVGLIVFTSRRGA